MAEKVDRQTGDCALFTYLPIYLFTYLPVYLSTQEVIMGLVLKSQRSADALIHPYRWTRREYEKMVEVGFFPPEVRLELIEGEILTMAAQSSHHAVALSIVQSRLNSVYTVGYYMRIQMPLALGDNSEPEPDIAIVRGQPLDYYEQHPTTAVLVVEVAYSSLEYDQQRKLRLYARHAIPEYWIVNLAEYRLEVYREPVGELYRLHLLLQGADRVAPLSHPEQSILVADLLP